MPVILLDSSEGFDFDQFKRDVGHPELHGANEGHVDGESRVGGDPNEEEDTWVKPFQQLEFHDEDEDELESELFERIEADKRDKLEEYKNLVEATEDIPLLKLILSPSGVDLFDELCMRVDVNAQYAECLPQWGDLASKLEVQAGGSEQAIINLNDLFRSMS